MSNDRLDQERERANRLRRALIQIAHSGNVDAKALRILAENALDEDVTTSFRQFQERRRAASVPPEGWVLTHEGHERVTGP